MESGFNCRTYRIRRDHLLWFVSISLTAAVRRELFCIYLKLLKNPMPSSTERKEWSTASTISLQNDQSANRTLTLGDNGNHSRDHHYSQFWNNVVGRGHSQIFPCLQLDKALTSISPNLRSEDQNGLNGRTQNICHQSIWSRKFSHDLLEKCIFVSSVNSR